MSAVFLFSGVTADRSGNFATPFFLVFRFKNYSSMNAAVLFSGVNVDRSGNFVTQVLFLSYFGLNISRR